MIDFPIYKFLYLNEVIFFAYTMIFKYKNIYGLVIQ